MGIESLLEYTEIAFVVLSVGCLTIMGRKRLFAGFPALAFLLGVQAIEECISIAILFFRKSLGIEVHLAYRIYFCSHWMAIAADTVLRIMVVYSVFSLAMRPLEGLHKIGKIIFRWVAAVSLMVSVAIAAGPHFTTPGYGTTVIITNAATQIQQGISVLTLCLLLFVCFSTKSLGLTLRSRIFGVSLGLGVMAMTTLVQSAWFSTTGAHSLYSPVYLFGVLGTLGAVAVWTTYFGMPEPARRMIMLPTTSPFFFWNQISEALGDSPGHVVIAGFEPDMLAAAEVQMFAAADVQRASSRLADELPELPAPSMPVYATR
jgi:hypothetical protein